MINYDDTGDPGRVHQAFRAEKVLKLVTVIDAMPHLGSHFSKKFARVVAAMPPEWWNQAAREAGVGEPSTETMQQVINFFRDRGLLRRETLASIRRDKQ